MISTKNLFERLTSAINYYRKHGETDAAEFFEHIRSTLPPDPEAMLNPQFQLRDILPGVEGAEFEFKPTSRGHLEPYLRGAWRGAKGAWSVKLEYLYVRL